MNIKVVMKCEQLWKRVLIKTFNGSHLRPPNDDIITLCPLKRVNTAHRTSVYMRFLQPAKKSCSLILNALSFRLSPFKWALWAVIIFAKRVSRIIWIYIHNSECGSSIVDRSICSRQFNRRKWPILNWWLKNGINGNNMDTMST